MVDITPDMVAALKQLAQSNVVINPVIKPGYGKTIPMPRKEYPDYEYRPYPKMLKEEFSKEYLEWWRGRNSYIDDRTGKTCYTAASPKVGSEQPLRANEADVESGYAKSIGEPVIVKNEIEEHNARRNHGITNETPKAKPVTVDIAGEGDDAEAEIAALKAKIKRIEAASGTKRKPGRPAKPKQTETVTVSEIPAED